MLAANMDSSTQIPEGNQSLKEFVDFIKFGHSTGSYELAKKTVDFLLDFLFTANKWNNVREMFEEVTRIGRILVKVDQSETVVGNMVKRVLKIIRDEASSHSKGTCEETHEVEETLQKIVSTKPNSQSEFDLAVSVSEIEDPIRLAIGELLSELETSGGNIAQLALEHIYSDEVIMTIGQSKTVEAFLKYAAKNKRKFQVIVAECAPFYKGHELAISLAKDNINTILIPDSAIFSVMSRVNKVIIGAHSIMTNGGIKAISGSYILALAAKHYSVPFIVCTGMYKLTSQYLVSHDQLAFNKFSSPQDILSYEADYSTKCQVLNPVFDYVPPELVTVFVSNVGGNLPSYMYRLLTELYHPHDELE